jgi:hypothetical protein
MDRWTRKREIKVGKMRVTKEENRLFIDLKKASN